eukprot:TRINITY_DN1425_c0_g2_i2.p2 TRINITY_DN1425_c0_g2~~TRINITY_DN1425_c0_g2_i2.p2  ORF type:complete len:185 (-),score=36.78 TRINITY_DN1425_c0_g2_i2:424-978(-)
MTDDMKHVESPNDVPIEIIDLDNDKITEPERKEKAVETKPEPKPEIQPAKKSFSFLSCLCPICTLQFYAPYFNISTYELLLRLFYAIFPYTGALYPRIKQRPDLYLACNEASYGPVWIYFTIVYLFTFLPNAHRYFSAPDNYGDFDFSLFFISFAIVRCTVSAVDIWHRDFLSSAFRFHNVLHL